MTPKPTKSAIVTVYSAHASADEASPLLRDGTIAGGRLGRTPSDQNLEASTSEGSEPPLGGKSIMSILSVLFVGVFVANIDMTFMLAAYPRISSDLHAFREGSWLMTAYMLAMCATQPLYGKLSNIFGRKPLLLATYMLYACGSTICAVAGSMHTLILGRVVGGAGGAGMVCLVSIIIADIVPLQYVAAYRSYVNIVQTVGRSVGAPLGGLIVERVGWRSAFATLAPLSVLGAGLVSWRLPALVNPDGKPDGSASAWQRVKRIDFLGSLLLSLTIVQLLLLCSLGGNTASSAHDPRLYLLVVGGLLSGTLFWLVETYRAREPIFPPPLLTIRAVVASYGLLLLQNAAQSIASFSIPLFFQILLSIGPSASGAFLLPSVLGNTLGGLGTGEYVRRTGRYKSACIVAAVAAVVSYLLMFVRWGTEQSFMPVLEDVYVFGAGLGTGIAYSAAFVVLTAGISSHVLSSGGDQPEIQSTIAIAGSGMYLSGNIGAALGVSLSSAVLQLMFKNSLARDLDSETLEEVVKKALDSIDWIQELPPGSWLRGVVVDAYIRGLKGTFLTAAIFSSISLLAGLLVVEHGFE